MYIIWYTSFCRKALVHNRTRPKRDRRPDEYVNAVSEQNQNHNEAISNPHQSSQSAHTPPTQIWLENLSSMRRMSVQMKHCRRAAREMICGEKTSLGSYEFDVPCVWNEELVEWTDCLAEIFDDEWPPEGIARVGVPMLLHSPDALKSSC